MSKSPIPPHLVYLNSTFCLGLLYVVAQALYWTISISFSMQSKPEPTAKTNKQTNYDRIWLEQPTHPIIPKTVKVS